jgi:type II secretory pathway component PulK
MSTRRRGTILIVVMLVISALAGVALVIARSARVEALTSANNVAAAKAAAVERGAEQYVLAMIASNRETVMTLDERGYEAVPVGTSGMFWVVRPDYGDANLPVYGLVDEASKLNLTTVSRDLLRGLPLMPDELPDGIYDWKDGDDNVEGDGAESQYYNGQQPPYDAKNANFESVEELLLVRGAYPEMLFGTGARGGMLAANAGNSAGMRIGSMGESDMLMRGLQQYLTVYSREPNGNNTRTGRINVNTAPREILACLPGLTDTVIDSILSARQSNGFGATNTDWFQKAILQNNPAAILPLVTGSAYQFSADIVAVSNNGRAFRRARIVVDAYDQQSPPKIVYRHDLTDCGWPLDRAILESLRAGQSIQPNQRRG